MALAESLKFDDVENDRLDYLQFVREGEKPKISYHKSEKELADELIRCIRRLQETDPESSIAIIHRYDEAWRRMEIPLQKYLSKHLDLISTKEYNRRYNYQAKRKPIFFTDVYSIKGLEFDHVFVIHFDRDHYPLKTRFEELNKLGLDRFSEQYQKDYNRLYNDEKKLLYVAMTRAKHTLRLMYYAEKPERISQFVRDFHIDDYEAIGFDRSKYRK
jgi:superfamily I DNA/RNA helicase